MPQNADEQLVITIVQSGNSVHVRAARRTVSTDRNGKEYVSSQLLHTRTIRDTRIADYPADMLSGALVASITDEIQSLIPFLR